MNLCAFLLPQHLLQPEPYFEKILVLCVNLVVLKDKQSNEYSIQYKWKMCIFSHTCIHTHSFTHKTPEFVNLYMQIYTFMFSWKFSASEYSYCYAFREVHMAW